MTEQNKRSVEERKEKSAILDTIDAGRVRVRKGSPRKLNAGINMCSSMMSGEVPDLMEIEPARFFE